MPPTHTKNSLLSWDRRARAAPFRRSAKATQAPFRAGGPLPREARPSSTRRPGEAIGSERGGGNNPPFCLSPSLFFSLPPSLILACGRQARRVRRERLLVVRAILIALVDVLYDVRRDLLGLDHRCRARLEGGAWRRGVWGMRVVSVARCKRGGVGRGGRAPVGGCLLETRGGRTCKWGSGVPCRREKKGKRSVGVGQAGGRGGGTSRASGSRAAASRARAAAIRPPAPPPGAKLSLSRVRARGDMSERPPTLAAGSPAAGIRDTVDTRQSTHIDQSVTRFAKSI